MNLCCRTLHRCLALIDLLHPSPPGHDGARFYFRQLHHHFQHGAVAIYAPRCIEVHLRLYAEEAFGIGDATIVTRVVQHLRHEQVEGGEGYGQAKDVQRGGGLEAARQVEERRHDDLRFTNLRIYNFIPSLIYYLRMIGLVARLRVQRYTHFHFFCKSFVPLSAPSNLKTSKKWTLFAELLDFGVTLLGKKSIFAAKNKQMTDDRQRFY